MIEEETSTSALGDTSNIGPRKVDGTFAGMPFFDCPNDTFSKCISGRKKGGHYKTFMGDNDFMRSVRQFAKLNPNKKFMFRDEMSGNFIFTNKMFN